MKVSKIQELNDEELKAFYMKSKRNKTAAMIAAPVGGVVVGLVTGKSVVTFLPATAAYCALCGVCSYKTSNNYYNAMEELSKRDTTRRFLFEELKKSNKALL